MKQIAALLFSLLLLHIAGKNARAETWLVGPGKPYETLQEVTDLLNPGDLVEVDGNTTYPAGVYVTENGEADNWITIKGITPDGGTRPLIDGSADYGINISADYIVLEGFEVTSQPKGICTSPISG